MLQKRWPLWSVPHTVTLLKSRCLRILSRLCRLCRVRINVATDDRYVLVLRLVLESYVTLIIKNLLLYRLTIITKLWYLDSTSLDWSDSTALCEELKTCLHVTCIVELTLNRLVVDVSLHESIKVEPWWRLATVTLSDTCYHVNLRGAALTNWLLLNNHIVNCWEVKNVAFLDCVGLEVNALVLELVKISHYCCRSVACLVAKQWRQRCNFLNVCHFIFVLRFSMRRCLSIKIKKYPWGFLPMGINKLHIKHDGTERDITPVS